MNETRVVSEVHSLRQLDGYIINHLNVGTRHINRKIQIQPFYMLEHVAPIVVLSH